MNMKKQKIHCYGEEHEFWNHSNIKIIYTCIDSDGQIYGFDVRPKLDQDGVWLNERASCVLIGMHKGIYNHVTSLIRVVPIVRAPPKPKKYAWQA